jgi:hypothetical protein
VVFGLLRCFKWAAIAPFKSITITSLDLAFKQLGGRLLSCRVMGFTGQLLRRHARAQQERYAVLIAKAIDGKTQLVLLLPESVVLGMAIAVSQMPANQAGREEQLCIMEIAGEFGKRGNRTRDEDFGNEERFYTHTGKRRFSPTILTLA